MSSTQPTLLVLAAGMGSRYGGLKQMDPMGPGGETVLDYSVFDAMRAGFGKVVFVIREDFAAEFRGKIGARFADRVEVDYAFQDLADIPPGFAIPEGRIKPWGTAHAVRAARHVVHEPFAVINADDFYGEDAYRVMCEWFSRPHGHDHRDHYAMIGYPLRNTLSAHGQVNRGICDTDPKGFLTGVREVLEIARNAEGIIRGKEVEGTAVGLSGDLPASMNFWGFTPAFFAQLDEHFERFLAVRGREGNSECYIPTVVDDLIHSGRADCQVLETCATWFGVTYPEDKPHVMDSIAALVRHGRYPSRLH